MNLFNDSEINEMKTEFYLCKHKLSNLNNDLNMLVNSSTIKLKDKFRYIYTIFEDIIDVKLNMNNIKLILNDQETLRKNNLANEQEKNIFIP